MAAHRGDTIFALASARGRSGVAVFRVSGPDARDVVLKLCGDVPDARRASLRTLSHDGEVIDEALVLVFDEGASFTGEAVAEFHVHGSVAVARKLETVLGTCAGCRPASAGEFTRRALENGRLDLTQVEGLADLIDAETEAQLRQAQRTSSGEFGRRVSFWRDQLVRAAALIEASIDFSEEEIPEGLDAEAETILQSLLAEWEREISGSRVAERVRDGFEVAIVGAPNAGKSSLINAIAGRDVAITSPHAGTTRDVIEVRADLGGLPVTFLDTAGVRETADEIEVIGVNRTRSRAEAADLRLFMDRGLCGIAKCPGDIQLHAKCDLGPGEGLNISALTGEGLEDLLAAVAQELEGRMVGQGLATHARHREALQTATRCVSRALERVGRGTPELVADELRATLAELDILIGRVDVEDILGHIFSSFCIGK